MTDDAAETDETHHADGETTESKPGSKSAPLSDLAGRVADRKAQTQHGSTTDSVDEFFDSIEVEELDEDVWTALVEGGKEEPGVGDGAEATPVDEDESGVEHVVPKESFCQRCEFFEAPPTFGCTHEGTNIIEAVDSDHFRVHNCPMADRDDE
ncbi:hypothetical protein [Haloferax sp. DFSO60]|uniref:hypothetical protein n=1 Tax=Haloferax sp. DFSO60 TaxID=3388652 RepID=UPI00397CC0C7